jgi:hypothetical protein
MQNIMSRQMGGVDEEARAVAKQALDKATAHDTMIGGLGSAASANVGVAPEHIPQLDAEGRLPAIDGSQLLNLPAGGDGVDQTARDAAAAAQATAHAKLAPDGDGSQLTGVAKPADIPTGALASQDRITVSQISDPQNLPEGSGSRKTEIALTPAAGSGQDYVKINSAQDGVDHVPAPSPLPGTNHALARANWFQQGGTPTIGAEVTVAGVPGREMSAVSGWYRMAMASVATPVAGESYHIAALIDASNSTSAYERLSISDVAGGEHYSYQFNKDGTTQTDGTNWGSAPPPFTVVSASITEQTSNVWLLKMAIQIDATLGGDLVVSGRALTAGETVSWAMLTLRQDPYDPTADDGTEAFLHPDLSASGSTATLTLDSGGGYQRALALAEATELVLPAAPGAGEGVRSHVVRVTFNGGSLAMPASGAVVTAAAAGPYSSDLELAVDQYDDGSDASIHVIERGVG